jgi:Icc protein
VVHRILHLTDLHLMSDAEQRLRGVPTQSTLTRILHHVREHTFDLLVITGDLAHDEQGSTYDWLRSQLGDCLERCRFLPGNHDNRALLRATFPEHVVETSRDAPITFRAALGPWRLIGLDTQLTGSVAGDLDREQLTWLQEELDRCAPQPTILFMHHPPIPIASEWLDAVGLQDPRPFQKLISRAPHVRLILAGHVHQEFSGQLEQADVWTTPSTAVQFVPGQTTPTYDAVPPGFRLIELDAEAYHTQVIRLPQLEFPPDPNA